MRCAWCKVLLTERNRCAHRGTRLCRACCAERDRIGRELNKGN